MRKEDFVMALLEALKAAEGPRGGQSMNQKDGKAPEEVLFDELLKKAENPEEFVKLIREGKAFRLEEKAGIHIISLDTEKPPIVQVTGEFNAISEMLSFAMLAMIERAAENRSGDQGIQIIERRSDHGKNEFTVETVSNPCRTGAGIGDY